MPLSHPPFALCYKVESIGDVPEGYVFEPKLDGVRAMLVRTNDGFSLWGRDHGSGERDNALSLQDGIREWALSLPEGTVLDGELIVPTPSRPWGNFPIANGKLSSSGRKRELNDRVYPLKYAVFDCLGWGGSDFRGWRLMVRREKLSIVLGLHVCDLVVQVPWIGHEVAEAALGDARFEGVVAKDPSSPYPAGRSRAWIKVRRMDTFDAEVESVEIGDGGKAILNCVDDEGARFRVSNLSDREGAEIRVAMAGGRVVIEARAAEKTADGKRRFPIYVRRKSSIG